MSDGTIHQLNVSGGGVPKRPIDVGEVTTSGLVGDACAKVEIHGGPDQALSLFALERIEALAAEGHPISPGSTGENVTTRGLEWNLDPGTRVRLGADVVIEITRYAAPCKTIAGSFSDGDMNRLNQMRTPGWSRLYASVLAGGVLRPGDPITIEARPDASIDRSHSMDTRLQLGYVNVYVSDLARSMKFFEEELNLTLQFGDAKFGYASFDAGPIRIGLAQVDTSDETQRALVGRQTGVGFAVANLRAAHAELVERGVSFPMAPAKQPWGGFMAMFEDPDANTYYLDELQPE